MVLIPPVTITTGTSVHELSPGPNPQVDTLISVRAVAGRRLGHCGAIGGGGGFPGVWPTWVIGPKPQLFRSGGSGGSSPPQPTAIANTATVPNDAIPRRTPQLRFTSIYRNDPTEPLS